MIGPFIHRWERRLAARDTDRHAYDFGWGTELLGPGLPASAEPAVALRRWAAETLRSPATFFADPGPPEAVERSALDRVRFDSAVLAPEPEVNRVVVRVFRPRHPDGRAMVVLPQWNADESSHVGLCRWLAERGITAARLTLPYHESRGSSRGARADRAISANIGRTLLSCQQAVSDVRRTRYWLESEGHDRIGVIGTSLGSCVAFLALAQEPRFKVAVLHHVSSHFGDVVWRGISTRHVRAVLERNCSLAALRRFWAPISPIHWVDNVSPETHTLLLSGRYDLTFPYDLSRRFHRAFRERGLPHRVIVVPWGHYTSGVFPFNVITVGRVLRYLDRRL